MGIADVGYAKYTASALLVFKQAQAKEIKAGLTLVQTNEPRWSVVENLAAELGTDGARGAGYQYATAGELVANCFEVDLHALAAEQIFEADFTQLADRNFPCDDVFKGGHRAEADSRAIAGFNESAHLRAGGGRHGDERFLSALRGKDFGKLRDCAEDAHVINPNALF